MWVIEEHGRFALIDRAGVCSGLFEQGSPRYWTGMGLRMGIGSEWTVLS